jgi:hypothetical protein
VQMHRAKVSVRTVPAWGERKTARGVAGGVKPVRPVWRQQAVGLVFVLVMSLGLLQEVVVLVVGQKSLQVVSVLGVPPSCSIRGWEDSWFEIQRRNDPRSSFHGFGPPPGRDGDALECAKPTLEQMARH